MTDLDSKYRSALQHRWQFMVNDVFCTLRPLAYQQPASVKTVYHIEQGSSKKEKLAFDLSFKSYLSRFDTKLKRLKKDKTLEQLLDSKIDMKYIPQSCLLINCRNSAIKVSQVLIQTIEHDQNKANDEKRVDAGIAKLPDNWLLYTWRGLAFAKLSYAQFLELFRYRLLLVGQQFHELSPKRLNGNNTRKIEESALQQSLDNPSESKQGDRCSVIQEINLQKLIFDNFPLSRNNEIYWPCVVLKPISDHKHNLKNFLKSKQNRQFDLDDHSSAQSAIFAAVLKQAIESKDLQKQNNSKQEKVKQLKQFSDRRQNSFFVKLVGTNKILQRQTLLSWGNFGYKLNKIYSKHKQILQQLIKYSQFLKKFKALQESEITQQNSTGRFCTYTSASNPKSRLGLVLKYQKNKVHRKMLIRIMEKSKERHLRWVKQSSLRVNLTLPALSEEEISHFIGKEIIEQNKQSNVRCYECFYQVKEHHSRFQCQSCDRIWHYQCRFPINQFKMLEITEQYKNTAQNESPKMEPQRRTKTSLKCSFCRPCDLCSFKLVKPGIQCLKCRNLFHYGCAEFSVPKKTFNWGDQFLCLRCLVCKICGKVLKGQMDQLNIQSLECRKCIRLQDQGLMCTVCYKGKSESSSLSCEICKKMVHAECDSLLFRTELTERSQYKCRNCRILLKRQLLKLVTIQLRKFDEMQYFYQPCFQQLPNYERIVDRPSCVMVISDKISDGHYDNDPLPKLKADFKRIIENALSFNQAKSDPYYRAKILYIIGQLFIERVGGCIDADEAELMRVDVRQIFDAKVNDFYIELKRNYLTYLLNYSAVRSVFEVRYEDEKEESSEQGLEYYYFKFASSAVIKKQLERGLFSVALHKKSEKVECLLAEFKRQSTVFDVLSASSCYYHPQQHLPIIYQCPLCWQTYCCTRRCLRHPPYNAQKPQFTCGCNYPPNSHQILRQKGQKLGYSVAELTQFYKYCPYCIEQQIQERMCCVCNRFCCYGYNECKCCERYFHFNCAVTYGYSLDESEMQELSQLCPKCLDERFNKDYRALLEKLAKKKAEKLNKIREFMPIFRCIVAKQKMMLGETELMQILYKRYAQLIKRQQFCKDLTKLVKQVPKSQLFFDFDFADIMQFEAGGQSSSKIVNGIEGGLEELKGLVQMFADIEIGQREAGLSQSEVSSSPSSQDQQPIQHYFQTKNFSELRLQAQKSTLLNTIRHEELSSKKGNFPIQGEIANDKASTIKRDYFSYRRTNSAMNIQQPIILLTEESFNTRYGDPTCHQNTYKLQKAKRLFSYLRVFLLRLYNEEKRYWRRGNTCVMQYSQDQWHCLKKYNNRSYEFQISKEKESWWLRINGEGREVADIGQLIDCIKEVNPNINDRKDLVAFLGLNLKPGHNSSYNFTKLLAENVIDQMTRRERSQYIRFYIQNQSHSQTNNNLKRLRKKEKSAKLFERQQIYYLKKIPTQEKDSQNKTNSKIGSKLDIKITEDDIKRDLGLIQELDRKKLDSFITKNPLDCLYVAISSIDRLGLFTKKAIPANTAAIEYVGELLSEPIADLRQNRYKLGCYMFGLQSQSQSLRFNVVDATFVGNMSRYLNHSCDANCRAARVLSGDVPRIVVYTVRDVAAYEELTYDYLFRVESKERLECRCQAYNCQGRIN